MNAYTTIEPVDVGAVQLDQLAERLEELESRVFPEKPMSSAEYNKLERPPL